MRKAKILIHGEFAADFVELDDDEGYYIKYDEGYNGPPISLTMPVSQNLYEFETFPPYFEGVLPEGGQLEGLLKRHKIEADDFFSQLLVVGLDLVGAVTVYDVVEIDLNKDELETADGH